MLKINNKLVKILVYVWLAFSAFAHSCDYEGETCLDHEQCCGGCCFDGVCIDTYRSCSTPFDVCKNHICLGEENCVVFVPPECPGCEPLPLCRVIV